MCVPILRSIGTKLTKVRKYAKITFYLIYLTSCDAFTSCVMGTATLLIGILSKEHFETNQKSLHFRKNSGFRVFLDLDL